MIVGYTIKILYFPNLIFKIFPFKMLHYNQAKKVINYKYDKKNEKLLLFILKIYY